MKFLRKKSPSIKSKKNKKTELQDLSLHYALVELAERLDIKIIKNKMEDSNGGLCKVKGKYFLYLSDSLSTKNQNELILNELSKLDTSKIFVKPSLRKMLEKNRINKE